jgi:NTP pyrophosphatase (non-canonical NTP hydrolase)
MLFYLRKELIEVEEELRKDEIDGTALADELGDVLFDALMLIEVTQRTVPQVSLEACAASANRKLRRRCPYIFGGATASTIEEAEAAWQAAKRAERETEAAAATVRAAPAVEPAAAALPPEPMAANATAPAAAAPAALAPAASPVGMATVVANAPLVDSLLDDEDDDTDAGLAEWEADLRRDREALTSDEDGEY